MTRKLKTQGFIELSGKGKKWHKKPCFWQITAKAITQDPKTGEQQSKHFILTRLQG